MRAKTVYICGVCNTEYNYQEEAEQCEDQPIIEPEWLKIGFEKGFYGFGETGVKFFLRKGELLKVLLMMSTIVYCMEFMD